ncbi:MAG: hypothetical protein Q7U04_08745 [Bacteriovorax sp.]|nr:hypothetical protein [Bacteriovorax sp.]
MFVKKLFMATALLSTQVYAQSFSEFSMGDLSNSAIDYTKSHFSAMYHGEIYGVRRDVDSENLDNHIIKDYKIMHNPTLIYKPMENLQVLATAEFKFSDQPKENAGVDYPNGFYRGLFTLTRKNILSEKENGIQLDAGIGRRQFNTGVAQQEGGNFALPSYGNNRVFTTLTKTLGKSSTSLMLQYLSNDYKKSSEKTWKNGLEVIPTVNIQITDKLSYLFNDDMVVNTPKFSNTDRNFSATHDMNLAVFTFQWSDKISTYYQLKYLHIENFTNAYQSKDDSFSHFAGVGYAFDPKNVVTFEVGSELAHARDGRDGFSKKVLYPELAVYLDFAI